MFHEIAKGKAIQFWGCLSLSSTNCRNGRADDKMQLDKQVAAWKALIWEMSCTRRRRLLLWPVSQSHVLNRNRHSWDPLGRQQGCWGINVDGWKQAKELSWQRQVMVRTWEDEEGAQAREEGKNPKYEKKVERWKGLEMTKTCRGWNQIRKYGKPQESSHG